MTETMLFQKIVKAMQSIRQEMKQVHGDLNIPDIYFEETRKDDGSHCLMPLVALKTIPCGWLRAGGGCTMCGYQLVASLDRIPTEKNIINQTEYTIHTAPSKIYPLITFSTAGSFLDTRELSDELRPKLLKMLADSGYKEFNFESRPEFLLNHERLSQLKEYFDTVSVGMGLESKNNLIRNVCVNKGTMLKTYELAAEALQKHNIYYDAYVLVGKPFLTATEDIEDTLKTVQYAFDLGFGRIFLMLCNIQPSTLTYCLYKKGKFEIPMLWSAIEIIKRLPAKDRSRVYIKGFNRAVPMPMELPQNCEKCNIQVMDKLIHWNLTGDFKHIENLPICNCIDQFKERLAVIADNPLKERIEQFLDGFTPESICNEA